MSTKSEVSETTKRKHEIISKSAGLFVKYGYHKTTVRQIAAKAGLSMGGLYHYFDSKDAILSAVLELALERKSEFVEQVESSLSHLSSTQTLRFAIKQHILTVNEMQDIYLFFFQEGKYFRREDLETIMRSDVDWVGAYKFVLEKGRASGEFKINDTTIASINISHLCDMWVIKRWLLRNSYSVEQYIQEQQDFIIAAVTNVVNDVNDSANLSNTESLHYESL